MKRNTLSYSASLLCSIMLVLLLSACNQTKNSNVSLITFEGTDGMIHLDNTNLVLTDTANVQSFAKTLLADSDGSSMAMLLVAGDDPKYSNARTTSSGNTKCSVEPNDQHCNGMSHMQQECYMDKRKVVNIDADLGNGITKKEFIGDLRLLWSKKCQSSSARASANDTYHSSIKTSTYQGTLFVAIEKVSITREDGKSESYDLPLRNQRTGYTGMLYAPIQKVRACATLRLGLLGDTSYESYIGYPTEVCTKTM